VPWANTTIGLNKTKKPIVKYAKVEDTPKWKPWKNANIVPPVSLSKTTTRPMLLCTTRFQIAKFVQLVILVLFQVLPWIAFLARPRLEKDTQNVQHRRVIPENTRISVTVNAIIVNQDSTPVSKIKNIALLAFLGNMGYFNGPSRVATIVLMVNMEIKWEQLLKQLVASFALSVVSRMHWWQHLEKFVPVARMEHTRQTQVGQKNPNVKIAVRAFMVYPSRVHPHKTIVPIVLPASIPNLSEYLWNRIVWNVQLAFHNRKQVKRTVCHARQENVNTMLGQ